MVKQYSRLFSTLLILTSAATFIAGCGGSGSSAPTPVNTYSANYSGASLDSNGGVSAINVYVDSKGVISGATISGGVSTALNGLVTNSGRMTITKSGLGSGTTLAGQLSTRDASTVSGIFSDTPFSHTVYVVLVVNPQAAVNGGNTFSGDFAGNCTDTVTGKTSPFGLTIDSTGRVGGQILGYVNGVGVMSTVIGSVTSPGVFNLTEYVNGSSIGTLSGSVSLNGSALTGTLTNNSSNSVSLSGSVVPQI